MSRKRTFEVIANLGSAKAQIVMTGYISPWENNASDFLEAFKELEKQYDEIDIVIMNLYGGSVFEGIPIYNIVKNSKAKTNTYVHGVAASMGSIIALSGNNSRLIAPMSRLMIHRAKAGQYGDHEDMMDMAKLLEDVQADLTAVYVANSNKDESWVVKNWMARGKDTWLNINECLDMGLMTGTTESLIKNDIPENILTGGDIHAVVAFYQSQINKHNIQPMKELLAELGLLESATPAAALAALTTKVNSAVDAAVQEKEKTIAELEARVADLEKSGKREKASVLVDAAVASGKILPAAKETWAKLAEGDYDSTKEALDKIPARKSITSQIKEGEEEKTDDPVKGRTFKQLQKEDPKVLEALRKDDPERFEKLKEESYPKKK